VGLRFVRWFDFDEFGFRDLRYLLVRIASAANADVSVAPRSSTASTSTYLDERALPAKESL
jgi:hypothetical protein